MSDVNTTGTTQTADVTEQVDPDGAPWWSPSAAVNRATRVSREVEKRLARQPLARLTLAMPRTARFVARELTGDPGDRLSGMPPVRITPSLVGHVVPAGGARAARPA